MWDTVNILIPYLYRIVEANYPVPVQVYGAVFGHVKNSHAHVTSDSERQQEPQGAENGDLVSLGKITPGKRNCVVLFFFSSLSVSVRMYIFDPVICTLVICVCLCPCVRACACACVL